MIPDWESPCGTVSLYRGDCREVIPSLGNLDAVVTDPPYGLDIKSHVSLFAGATMCQGDESVSIAEQVLSMTSSAQQVAFFSPFAPYDIKWRSVLVWSKGGHVGIGGDRETCWKRDAELIGVRNNKPLNGKRDSCVLDFPAVMPGRHVHFCEKPIRLMEYIIGKLDADSILDPFMGSGTTGVAAVRLGKRFVGIEIDPEHFETARRRIMIELGMEARNADGTTQRRLFAGAVE